MRHVILNFHGIGSTPLEREPGESNYWISNDFFDEILSRVHHHRHSVTVSLTFDDGNKSDLAIGAEALLRGGMTARFFVLTGRIGETNSLDVGDIRELVAMGHEIGNHGADHVDWTALDEKGLERELGSSQTTLSEITGSPVTSAAIPFGRYNKRVLTALKRRGYTTFYSSDGGAVTSNTMPLPRTSIRGDMVPGDVDEILVGREAFDRRLRRPLARLVKRSF
jgi:peptidoglycan/xylan/chitin deacetylase (PgdA/CDA1 family)